MVLQRGEPVGVPSAPTLYRAIVAVKVGEPCFRRYSDTVLKLWDVTGVNV